MRKRKRTILFGALGLLVVGAIVLSLPPVWSRVVYHVREIYIDIFYKLNPPEEDVFNPSQNATPDEVATAVKATLIAMQPATSTPTITPTPEATQMPTPTLTPLPPSGYLKGVRPEGQLWSNCGPATLAMNLSYWGWSGDQYDTRAALRPNERDKNVMPYEIVDYVNSSTDLSAIQRMGGDLNTLKALVSIGVPVLLEKGYEPENWIHEELGWMGHYNLVIGYDDAKSAFITMDSYLLAMIEYDSRSAVTGYEVTYADMEHYWKHFNNVFIVVYPPDLENDVLNTLGPLADENYSYQKAYDQAVADTTAFTEPQDLFFAWFNVGTSLVKLQDYMGAARAYDMAYSIYPTIPEQYRPYRMLWYQTGPYYAYYFAGRYPDLINLTTLTINAESEHLLEESYHWRALAEIQLGNTAAAVEDLRHALKVHPGFAPSYEQLVELGETP